jgi:hypothetical protein
VKRRGDTSEVKFLKKGLQAKGGGSCCWTTATSLCSAEGVKSKIGEMTNVSLTLVTRSVGGVRLTCREGMNGSAVYIISIPNQPDGRSNGGRIHDERLRSDRRWLLHWLDSSLPPLLRGASEDETFVILHCGDAHAVESPVAADLRKGCKPLANRSVCLLAQYCSTVLECGLNSDRLLKGIPIEAIG